jgi:regulation of enolase protein 1 (concanavalin A-like superfamily)
MRNGLTAGAAHASMFVSSAKGLAFQRRKTAGGTSTSTAGSLVGAPYWVRISRVGNEFTASVSSDGSNWTVVGMDTIAMGSTIQVGLAVTSHLDGALSTGTFGNVSVGTTTTTQTASLPDGWANQDVGSTSPAGTASYDAASGTYTLTGAGSDIWGTADAFHFASTTLDGDGQIVARVSSVQNVESWTKAGVMIRATTASNSAHAAMFVTPSSVKGTAFQRRPTTGGSTVNTAGPLTGPPMWVRLVRSGSTVTASTSPDGSAWTDVDSQTIALDAVARIGLAVTSHRNGTLATVTFDNVTVIS